MQFEENRGADAPADAPVCPKTAAEQRAALRAKIEAEALGRDVRAHARAVFEVARTQPPAIAAIFRARQIGEAIGEQRERLRQLLPDNPVAEVILELAEEIWAETYDAAEREYDHDPAAIEAARAANEEAHHNLENAVHASAQRCFLEMKEIENVETARGVSLAAALAFVRGKHVGQMIGAIRATFDPSGPIPLDQLEEAVTSLFDRQLAVLETLDATAAAGEA